MAYKASSNWSELNELRCLLIFKKLEKMGFPHGPQKKFCLEITEISGLDCGNLSAKVCNYKSVAGVNAKSNASENTRELYERYKDSSVEQLQEVIEKIEKRLV